MRRPRTTNRVLLERRALLAARALVDRMRTLYRELERHTGAPIAVHRALACIGAEPGMVASKLAAALGMRRPALSQVLRVLVERGWAVRERSDTDQRSVRIYLTSSGRLLVGATAGRAVGTLQRAVRQVSNTRLEGLAAGLEDMLAHLPTPARAVTGRAHAERATARREARAALPGRRHPGAMPASRRPSSRVMR